MLDKFTGPKFENFENFEKKKKNNSRENAKSSSTKKISLSLSLSHTKYDMIDDR
jgi:hypothetical protein